MVRVAIEIRYISRGLCWYPWQGPFPFQASVGRSLSIIIIAGMVPAVENDMITDADLDLNLPDLTPSEMRVVETAISEWERSDNPHARRIAGLYRDLMRDTDKALEMLEQVGEPWKRMVQ